MLNWFKVSFTQIGKATTLKYLADRLLRKIKIGSIYPYYFFAQPLNDEVTEIRMPKGYHVTQIEPGNPCLSNLLTPSVCESRFQQKAICIGAFKGETLAAFLWFTPGIYHEDEVRADFIPPGGGCWDFGVHIEPEYRMTRAFSCLWISSCRIMKDMGFDTSFSRISAFNPVSVKAHTRMGAKLFAKATFINIGPIQLTFSTIRPLFNISLSARSRPVFQF